MRGRKRTPTPLKLIQGNPSRRPLPENEPQPEPCSDAPEWLSPGALKYWPMVAKNLDEVGVLTRMDSAALGLYCEVFSQWKEANDQVVRFGAVIPGEKGIPVQSPFLRVSSRAHDQLVKLLMEFGMTPASRSKVEVAHAKQQEKTGLQKYI